MINAIIIGGGALVVFGCAYYLYRTFKERGDLVDLDKAAADAVKSRK